jgi:hypothetical protein
MIEDNPRTPFRGLSAIGQKPKSPDKANKSNSLVFPEFSWKMKAFPIDEFIADSKQMPDQARQFPATLSHKNI